MNQTSKPKKLPKTDAKPTTLRKQTSRKANEQQTSRGTKELVKKNQNEESGQKLKRSPQMIKMMINQLEKQLAEKNKLNKTLNDEQFKSTARKFHSPKNTDFVSKTAYSTQENWKIPQKKKAKNTFAQISQKQPIKTQKVAGQKIVSKKKKIVYSSIQVEDNIKVEKSQPKQKEKKTKKGMRQNFVFLGNDLIQLNNIQIPLFIVENSRTQIQRSKRDSSRNEWHVQVDEKSSYLGRSKIASTTSVNSQASRQANFIERSYVQLNKSQYNDDFAFLNNTNNFFLRNQSRQETSTLSVKNNSRKEQEFDINQLIRLNNSVVKIQRWWRYILQKNKIQNEKLHSSEKKSVYTIQTREQSQKTIGNTTFNLSTLEADLPTHSFSQKAITSSIQEPQHSDILKLRQNAAHIQFSTHEQILKELLSKNKITSAQFSQKLSWIKQNLQRQICDISNVKSILKDSAKKVEDMMRKTKDDILIVKQFSFDDQYTQDEAEKSGQDRRDDILSTIFGSKVEEKESKNEINFQKKCKRMNVSTYEKDIDEFLNQNEDDQNSFISNKNRKMFNSPTSDQQEDLCSPTSNKSGAQQFDQIPSRISILQQAQFTEGISQVPSGSAQTSATPMESSNFQQLYKQYQEQEQTKKQIQSRISKQLGVADPHDLLGKSQGQIGITTSIVGVHKFLLNFFKFYLYYHKDAFLTYMNMPYGESIETRLTKNKLKDAQSALQNWTRTSLYTDDEEEIVYGLRNVIPEAVLEQFFQSYYEQTDLDFSQVQKTNIELQKIHNRAIFDIFNSALNFFRPYYNIGGAPYLWCSSEKSLTFYCIGEENIQEVYEKTQMKILKTSSYLCGALIDVPRKNKVLYVQEQVNSQKQVHQVTSPFKILENQQSTKQVKKISNFDQYLYSYTQNFNAAYFSSLEDRLKKKQLAQAEEENVQWFSNTFEESKVATLLNLTELIAEMILLEQCSILQNIQAQRQML